MMTFQRSALPVTALFLATALFPPDARAAAPVLEIHQRVDGALRIAWPDAVAAPRFALEQTDTLAEPVTWRAVAEPATAADGRLTVTLTPGAGTRFYRLRGSTGPLTTVQESSPAPGESGVAVTRESIFRLSGPLAGDVAPDITDLYAEFGGRRLLGRVELAGDRRTLTLFHLENLPASARLRVTLRGERLRDVAGNLLDADADGQPGGTRVLEFDTAGTVGLEGTTVVGHVYASERNADGSNHPLSNVTITVDGAEEMLRTTTDETGAFVLSPAPAGRFFVHVDGRTATGSRWPGGAYYPFVGKAWEAVAGRAGNLAGGSGEVFLPLIPDGALQSVSTTAETEIAFSPAVVAANPDLEGVRISVPANSLFGDSGQRGGRVGLAPVSPDRLPEPLPPGLNLPLVITVQTDGGANFDQPVPVKFPNLPDPVTGLRLGPGEKTVLWSFNHDTGRWEPQGTMTISADGRFAVNDPGVGIRQPGWHGVAPGTAAEGPEECKGDECDGPDCGAYPPRCCGSWDELKKPCKRKQEQALWAIADLAVDDVIFAFGGVGGCPLNVGLGAARAARDCILGNDCWGTVKDAVVGTAGGCAPKVGGLASLAWDAKSVIDSSLVYQDCLKTVLAACGAPVALASRDDSFAGKGDPRLEQAIADLRLQLEVTSSVSNALRQILGAAAWSGAESPEDLAKYQSLMAALAEASGSASPGGPAVTASERTAMLALPRPANATTAEVGALIDRISSIDAGLPTSHPTVRAELESGFTTLVNMEEKALAAGWTDLLDGLRRGMAAFGSMVRPPQGTFSTGRPFYLLRDLDTGFVQRGRLSAAGRFEGILLRPDAWYSAAYYHPGLHRMGATFFRSQPAGGAATEVPAAPFLDPADREAGSVELDSDQDGLSDHAEEILGTDPHKADTDGDGISDALEVAMDTSPTDGVAPPPGIVGAAATPGAAIDVAAENNLAVVACTNGLAVFDVSNPRSPVRAAVIPTPARAVALRSGRALVSFTDGVKLLDLSQPSQPVVLWSRADLSGATAIELSGRSAFVAVDTTFHRLSPATGSGTGSLSLPKRGVRLLARGTLVYAFGPDTLTVCRDDDVPSIISTAAASASNLTSSRYRLAAGPRHLYITRSTGFDVFSLEDPEVPRLVQAHTPGQLGWRQIVPTTGGYALAAVAPLADPKAAGQDVSYYQLNPGGTNVLFLTTFATPGTAEAVAIAGACAYVADGGTGLSVLSFLGPDTAGQAPTVGLELDYADGTARVQSDALIRLGARAEDDFGIRRVEFFIDDVLAGQDDSFPFEFWYRTPAVPAGTRSFTVRLRAEDTAGNVTTSPDFTLNVVPDATPPSIVALEPAPDSAIPPNVIGEVSVTLGEPVVTPVSPATLRLIAAGTDGQFGTADDLPITGTVALAAGGTRILLHADAPLPAGRYQATLAAGLSDAAGNVRPHSLVWSFRTGPVPHVTDVFPPGDLVRVGGTFDNCIFTFDQPLPHSLSDTYLFRIFSRDSNGKLTEVAPIHVELAADARTFLVGLPGGFPPGGYRVTGTGPNVTPMLWDFSFRVVPNEVTSTSIASGVGLVSNWKYPSGPASNDVLIVNLPGLLAPINTGGQLIRSLTAWTDIRLANQSVRVLEPIRCLAGLELVGARLAAGVTEVRGALTAGAGNDFGPHVLNCYGGGTLRGGQRFPSPDGALVNHPGSTLLLSNTLSIATADGGPAGAGRIVNLGTIRSLGGSAAAPTLRLDGVRLRNDGLVQIQAGGLLSASLEGDGTFEVGPATKLILSARARTGVSSRITGAGELEFGEFNPATRQVVSSADAELRGAFEVTGPVTVIAGTVSLWQPLVRSNTLTELRNAATLRLSAPAELDPVRLTQGTLDCGSDTRIGSLVVTQRSTVRAGTLVRITGEARLGQGLNVTGPGTVEFAGLTVVSNGTQSAAVYVGNGLCHNTGTWLQAGGGASGTVLDLARENGQSGTGSFLNDGTFEQTTDRPLTIAAPFRNAGHASFSRGPVSFEARALTSPQRGAYLPEAGAELVLNGTDLQYGNAGTLDLAAGTLRGTGTISTVNGANGSRVINRAVLRPGNPLGDLSVRASGGFEQTVTGVLVLTLADQGSSRLLLPSTPATLAGALRLELAGGFSPAVGRTFTLLTCGSRTGEFTTVELPNPGPGRKFVVSYGATAVTATVAVAP